MQLCDVKEDTYYCHEHALEYLQQMKQGQRRHCKLLYTHGKEEITTVIKMVNQRLEEESDSSSLSSDEIAIRRVSEVKQQQQMIQQHQVFDCLQSILKLSQQQLFQIKQSTSRNNSSSIVRL